MRAGPGQGEGYSGRTELRPRRRPVRQSNTCAKCTTSIGCTLWNPLTKAAMTEQCIHGFDAQHCASCRRCPHGLLETRCSQCGPPRTAREATPCSLTMRLGPPRTIADTRSCMSLASEAGTSAPTPTPHALRSHSARRSWRAAPSTRSWTPRRRAPAAREASHSRLGSAGARRHRCCTPSTLYT